MPKFQTVRANTTVAVQGFGNVGVVVADLLWQAGYRVVAVSDSQGGIYAKGGLDIPSVKQFKHSTRNLKAMYCEGTVCNILEYETITNEEVQNRSGLYWTVEEVNDRLKQKMVKETERIWEIAQQKSISMRTAAYVHALDRIGEAIDAKGTRDFYIS